MVLASLWLHLTLLLLLVVSVEYQHPTEGLPPPSTVAMVFENGNSQGAPQVAPQIVPGPPVDLPPVPTPRPTPRAAAVPPPPTPEAVPMPVPPPVPRTVPPETIPLPRVPSVPSPPAPVANGEIPPPPPPAPPVPRQAERPALAMVVPRPPLPQRSPNAEAPSRPRPEPAFPTPMNFSFGGSPQPPARAPSHPGAGGRSTLDISLTMRDGETGTTLNGRGGRDWGNELVAWVDRHKYYPSQAAVNGEDGDVTAQVVVNPDGHVNSVELKSRSGSQWLDMALVSLFRDATVPPPPDKNAPSTFNFTMHYILIRMR
jgi:periplasmic protein TonB